MAKKKPGDGLDDDYPRQSIFRVVTHRSELSPSPFTLAVQVNNPPSQGRDRTGTDRARLGKRIRRNIDKAIDAIANNPVFGEKGKIRVPVDGIKQPRWRPGRDSKGGRGGKGAGSDEENLFYEEMNMDDFVKWLLEDMKLPFLEKKLSPSIVSPHYALRGTVDAGPEERILEEHTEVARIERAIAMLYAHPVSFPVLNERIIDMLVAACFAPNVVAATSFDAGAVASSLLELKCAPPHAAVKSETLTGLIALSQWLAEHRVGTLTDEAVERLKRFIAEVSANPGQIPHLVPGEVPSLTDCPLEEEDRVYQRVEKTFEPDSECVVAMILDRSASMSKAMPIAKLYFYLNLLFLRTKYKSVKVVMIAHDGGAHEVPDEESFFKIVVGGGTKFVPAYELALKIFNERFPLRKYNRIFLQATDGGMIDPESDVTQWWQRLLSKGSENGACIFGGYLEIDPYRARAASEAIQWEPGGRALLALPDRVRKHVGMAHISTIEEVPAALAAIYNLGEEA